jgi:hypothetical protein
LEFEPVRPQNKWVDVMFLTAGISLFDFKLQHIPGEKHVGPDGLSQRPHAPEDDDNEEESVEEVEDWIDKVLGCMIWSKKDLEWCRDSYFYGRIMGIFMHAVCLSFA